MSDIRPRARREDLTLAQRLALPLVTAEELAVALALPSAEAANVLAQRREVPFVRVGKRNLFRLADVVEALWHGHEPALSEAEIRARLAASVPPRRSA